MEDFLDITDYEQILTFDELKKEVDEEDKLMSEEERHRRLIEASPTFKTYVLSLMNTNKAKSVKLNEYDYSYEFYY